MLDNPNFLFVTYMIIILLLIFIYGLIIRLVLFLLMAFKYGIYFLFGSFLSVLSSYIL